MSVDNLLHCIYVYYNIVYSMICCSVRSVQFYICGTFRMEEMGYASLAAKWHNIHRTIGVINDNIIVHLNERLDCPLRLAPWNSDFVMPGKLNATFTSIMTHAYSKTKRLTTIIDAKGQKHQLHHSAPRDPKSKKIRLPPQFYVKRKGSKVLDVSKRTKEAEPVESVEDKRQEKEEHQHAIQPKTESKDIADCKDSNADLDIANDPKISTDPQIGEKRKIAAEVEAIN